MHTAFWMSDDLSPASEFTDENQVVRSLRNGKIQRGLHAVKCVLMRTNMKMSVVTNDFG